ncbi:MAG TPA: peptidoglycan glycosyltransferase [Clostridiaceae bacterium]|nr:peptidoglycan glycosyltransferase [Clostridiaceae bacterium]
MLKKRAMTLFYLFLGAFTLLMWRCLYLQIFNGAKLSEAASSQRISDSDIERPRGDILDKNLIPLTNRQKKFTIVLQPLYLKENKEDLARVCEILEIDYREYEKRIEFEKQPIMVETTEEKKNAVINMKIPGTSAINSLKRYDENSVARHILGYLNKADNVGETGIEKKYNEILECDTENLIGAVIDARNNIVKGMGYRIIKLEGNSKKLNVKLTIDYHIQRIVEDVMDRNGIKGAVVVEDVTNGDIVAIASKPDFEQNRIADYLQSPDNELFNRATASYNLGSIFKILDAVLILENDIDIHETFYCPGYIKVGNKDFKCSSYNRGGHGELDAMQAFALSCNSYFINTGLQLGYRKIVEIADRFGLGSPTGIREQGIIESDGNIPDAGAYYSNGDIANLSIGQGKIMATPVQVANIIATVANGGIKNRVNIVDSIIDEDGNKIRTLRKDEGKRIISKDVADRIKKFMEEVTSTGTGTEANLDLYGGTGGKTGSAETSRSDVVHAWFGGYFPRVDPKYSICVFVENGQNGGRTAAPVFAEIAKEILIKGY